jgi:hypothetical protein
MKRNVWLYLLVSFGWTWACWIGGALLIQLNGYALDTEVTLFEVVGALGKEQSAFPQLLFALGVFGPILGSLIAGKPFKDFFFFEGAVFRHLCIFDSASDCDSDIDHELFVQQGGGRKDGF